MLLESLWKEFRTVLKLNSRNRMSRRKSAAVLPQSVETCEARSFPSAMPLMLDPQFAFGISQNGLFDTGRSSQPMTFAGGGGQFGGAGASSSWGTPNVWDFQVQPLTTAVVPLPANQAGTGGWWDFDWQTVWNVGEKIYDIYDTVSSARDALNGQPWGLIWNTLGSPTSTGIDQYGHDVDTINPYTLQMMQDQNYLDNLRREDQYWNSWEQQFDMFNQGSFLNQTPYFPGSSSWGGTGGQTLVFDDSVPRGPGLYSTTNVGNYSLSQSWNPYVDFGSVFGGLGTQSGSQYGTGWDNYLSLFPDYDYGWGNSSYGGLGLNGNDFGQYGLGGSFGSGLGMYGSTGSTGWFDGGSGYGSNYGTGGSYDIYGGPYGAFGGSTNYGWGNDYGMGTGWGNSYSTGDFYNWGDPSNPFTPGFFDNLGSNFGPTSWDSDGMYLGNYGGTNYYSGGYRLGVVDPYSIYQQSTSDWGSGSDYGSSYGSYGNAGSWGSGVTDYSYLMNALQQAQSAYNQRYDY